MPYYKPYNRTHHPLLPLDGSRGIAWASLLGLSGQVLLNSDPVHELPMDLWSRRPHGPYPQIWDLKVARGWGSWDVEGGVMQKTTLIISSLIILLAATVHAQKLPTIERPITIKEWLVVGPFSLGSREGYIDHLLEYGGEEGIAPQEGMTHHSILAPGGVVKWTKVTAKNGKVTIPCEGVDWEALKQAWGWAGTIAAGYAYTEYISQDKKHVLIMAEKVNTFYLNGKPYHGDPYGHHYVQVPVVLREGINPILVKVGGYGKLRFSFKMLPVRDPILLNLKDLTSPDLIRGKSYRGWLGIPLINASEQTIRSIKLITGGNDFFKKREMTIAQLPPLTIQKVPVPLETKPLWVNHPFQRDTVFLPITASFYRQRVTAQVPLRVKEPGTAFRFTFRSAIDSSVQYFAVLPPKDYDPKKSYALILSLHGAGVEAYGQVRAYAQKGWGFVVAPTNRRRFGFDWQDWGRLHALKVLELVKERFNIDENRVYLTGHSMGGHGTWHVGLHHPDLFAAMAPSAGWTSFNLYLPFFLRKGYIYTPPGLRSIWNMALREDRTPLFVENALNLPIFVMQGGKDEEVPPTHARLMVSLLKKLGYEVVYKEVPERGHWWDEEGVEGTACVDHPELMDFLRSKTRNPYPKKVIFKTIDLGLNNRSYWVQIDALDKLYRMGKITAEVKGERTVEVKVENLEQFTLFLSPKLVSPGKLNIYVNGQLLTRKWQALEPVTIHKKGDKFQFGRLKTRGLRKTPGSYGPIKAAYFKPFIFVYGTIGTEEETEWNLHLARNRAQYWWWRSSGYVQIVPDREMTPEMIKHYNLILFGGPETNSITAQINERLPISIKDGKVFLRDIPIEGTDLAVKFIYPNPLNPEKFILLNEGTSLKGQKLTNLLGTLYSAAGLPDYVIYDKGVKEKGWGGVLAAGFFDKNWGVKKTLGFIRE